jgi:hypothetical protein
MNQKLSSLRMFTSWVSTSPFWYNTLELTTYIEPDKEFWLMLYSISEVEDLAKKLFIEVNIPETQFDVIWKKLRSFIRQANNYWDAATKTNFRSAPLLFYYSFLNLVKAFLILRNSQLPSKLGHGIYYRKSDYQSNLKDKTIWVVLHKNDQIFPLYYKEIFNILPPPYFKITDLFGYLTDISFQYLQCNIGKVKTYPVIHRICFDDTRKKCWIVLAINFYLGLEELERSFPLFTEYFELVQPPEKVTSVLRDIFHFKESEWIDFHFYQFKEEKEINTENKGINTLIGEGIKILKNIFDPLIIPKHVDSSNATFYISLPLHFPNNQSFPMNEEVAIYLLMFFLSELVRYQPEYLDSILESKEAWLLRSFIESCPLKFLRIITSRIINKVIILKRE